MAPEDATPSTVLAPCAIAISIDPVFPRSSPKVLLRDSGDPHVATRSPIPARPAALSGSEPWAAHKRATSLSPRVMSIA